MAFTSARPVFNIVQRAKASYERIEEIGELPNDIDTSYVIDERPQGDIRFNINQFHFPGNEDQGIYDIHFTIKEGSTVGIVGRTGSGKSALIRLLLREFDTQHAQDIEFGGHPIRDYNVESLRAQFGYVPQEHFYFQQPYVIILHLVMKRLTMRKYLKLASLVTFTMISCNFLKITKP